MKKLLVVVGALFLALAASSSGSMAADLEPSYLKAPPPAPAFSWTGFYIGANLGGASSTQGVNGTQTTPFGSTSFSNSAGSNGDSGLLGGGQIGFNYEFPSRVVVGVEADGAWSNLTGGAVACSTFTTGAFAGLPAGCADTNTNLKDFGTVRGRLGYDLPWGPVMVYATGGWAFANVTGNSSVTCLGVGCAAASLPFTGGTSSFSNTPSGWTAGGGIEWAVVPNWTLRMEYLHLEFDNVATNYTTTVLAPGPLTSTTHVTSNNGVNVFRIGLNYLFHFGGY
jgi:outer membrane immunogenic protein